MSHTSRGRMLVVFVALAVAGCAHPAMVDRASEEQAIRAASADWMRSVGARDVDKVAAVYAPDAMVMMSNSPSLSGAAAIRSNWVDTFKMPGLSLTWAPTQIRVAESGDMATEVGTYRMSFDAPSGKVNDAGSYTTVWRKMDGRWRAVTDAVISSTPMPMAAAPGPAMMPDMTDMEMRAGRAVTWTDLVVPGFPAGAKIAVLHGDPGGKGDYTLRLQFPDGYMFPVHWHPGGEHLTVLSGSFLLAMGNTTDAAALKTYEPGDFLYIPGRNSHFGGARGTTVIQLHGMAPFAINLGVAK
ncbi:MAG: SgcJ/EcaC family oxidoreductase [Gemmatimonadota bacterium]|nr:SgcJ/EcaC family oxidoreductase [Gemmatimonadota bacterium]